MRSRTPLRLMVVAGCVAATLGCATGNSVTGRSKRPLKEISVKRWPILGDDLPMESLFEACDQSLAYLERVPPDRVFRFGREERTAAQLADGIKRFREILETEGDADRRTRMLKEEFILLKSVGRDGRGEVLYTGYYEPLLEARGEAEPGFTTPVFGVPDDLVTIDLSDFGLEPAPRSLVGRVEGHDLVPYPEREEIDFGRGLASEAPILGYVADPVEVFFLQVQGSGTLVFDDGTRLRAGYAVSNGRPYRSIGKLLIDDGLVPRDGMSMQAIKSYLAENPDEIRRVLSYNPSYVFFRPLDTSGGPLGCYGVPVTAGRSIATDRRLFPAPIPAWIEGTMPAGDGGEKSFARFALTMDTGGAIRGPGRVDLFLGAGKSAGEIAGLMQHSGRLYLLLPR